MQVLTYIVAFFKRKGFWPTFDEIGASQGITRGAVASHLRYMRKKGALDWQGEKRNFIMEA